MSTASLTCQDGPAVTCTSWEFAQRNNQVLTTVSWSSEYAHPASKFAARTSSSIPHAHVMLITMESGVECD